jgi:hypothetical protein
VRCSSRSGFSLVELLLASSLALGVMGLTLGVARRASDSYADSVLMGELEARSARVAREVRDLLADATLADESSVQLMDLRLFEERAWSLVVPRARWVEGQGRVEETLGLLWVRELGEAANGLDDDGDGLVDEGVLRERSLLPGGKERLRVLCRGVASTSGSLGPGEEVRDLRGELYAPPGLRISRVDDLVTVAVTLEARGAAGEVVRRTGTATLAVRTR